MKKTTTIKTIMYKVTIVTNDLNIKVIDFYNYHDAFNTWIDAVEKNQGAWVEEIIFIKTTTRKALFFKSESYKREKNELHKF